jgi:DNA-binding transcriptional MocR family regulator
VIGDGAHFYADEAASQHVRLSYGATSEAAMTEAVARLGTLVSSHSAG